VAKGEAIAGGAPQEPLIKVTPAANAMYNDPLLTKRLVAALSRVLGERNVTEVQPKMVFEDFAEFHLAGIPSADFWVGAVNPEKFAARATIWHSPSAASLCDVGTGLCSYPQDCNDRGNDRIAGVAGALAVLPPKEKPFASLRRCYGTPLSSCPGIALLWLAE
jgi:hypothetical protein